ncbi:hypothetical protein [Pseudomonas aeruginosa]|uniref:hypothetical protein n=1 Tax=Pseudomonas aeruginosa TaxID=287 RepID=UPI0019690419|nr:hypothetical protein [Pseudomonas aeruginosa]MBH4174347.1 hypothetical protein [Pseudomonas aeruginosa]HCF7250669.1 hypothetical protein [Pseudomonas aeruginosa]HEP8099218.1 hypothetical protein [Pseudomonas aeruginosa]HEP8157033.1 hypothetical protein [Pseudomonas aeruginosa]HEP8800096.1 hypothetical protein [Pseudomonas aeruginosa]
MNKANECTCPSGDGSLVHPCPAHPAVEQVGGDERAAFEAAFAAMGRPVCRADYDQDAYGTPFDDGGWTGWQARAALAQPSPVLPPFAEKVLAKLRRFYDCASDFESGGVDIGRRWLDLLTQLGLLNRIQRSPALWEISQQGEDLLGAPQHFPAQAEAERPEVAARVDGTDEDWFIHNEGLLFAGCELGRMIDFDRIVGALRAENAKLSEALDECDGDRWKLRSERDAANARLHEVATACATAEQERDSALARVAELEKELAMARDAASKGDAARHAAGGMEMEIQELREKVTELQKKLRSRWTYASTQATNCAGCGEHKHTPLRVDWMGGYVCLTCIDKKLEELHDAQTQHSVPEEFSFEYRHPNGESHTVTVSRDQVINEMPDFLFEALCSKFCNCEPVGETNVVECCCDEYAEEFKLLAAAPGKEVGHE